MPPVAITPFLLALADVFLKQWRFNLASASTLGGISLVNYLSYTVPGLVLTNTRLR